MLARLRHDIFRFIYRDDLIKLAIINGTDKWGRHWYAQHYQQHFRPLRCRQINLLEIGVGGHDDPHAGGKSLKTWKDYFPKGNIFGVDLYDKSSLQEPRIRIFQGSQADSEFLSKVAMEIGEVDIIIDDGSHINEHVLTSFQTLFPLLKAGGIYVVEDTQTSYWPEYGGSSTDMNSQTSMLGFFKGLTDGLNFEEIIRPGCAPSYIDRHIVSLHFYHNMVFIYKGANDEGSNVLTDNVWPADRPEFGLPPKQRSANSASQ